MRLPIYITLCIFSLIAIEFAVITESHLLSVLGRFSLKVFLLLLFTSCKPVKLSRKYIAFIAVAFLSDIISFFAQSDLSFLGISLGILFFTMYFILLYDSWKQFKIGRLNVIALSYAIVMAINAILILIQLKYLHSFMEASILIFAGQIAYHIMLWCVVAVSVAYYLNSYSHKSMLFLLGSLLFVCSDILTGAHYFYGIDAIILPFGALMSAAGYFFFFNYFHVKEESLLTEAELLTDIENREKTKRLVQD